MANNPFDRTIINPRERPLSSDINQAQSQMDRTMRRFFGRLFGTRASQASSLESVLTGFIGNSFRLSADGVSMFLTVRNGLGFFGDPAALNAALGGIVGLDDLDGYKPMSLNDDITFAVPAAPSGPNSRIDILEVRYNRAIGNPLSRDILDPGTGIFAPGLVNKSLSWDLGSQLTINGSGAINYKTGAPAVSPSAPGVDSGYVKIAEVAVGSSVTTLSYSKIKDLRNLLFPGGNLTVSGFATMTEVGGGIANLSGVNIIAPPGVDVFVCRDTSGVNTRLRFIVVVVAGNLAGKNCHATCSGFLFPGTGFGQHALTNLGAGIDTFTGFVGSRLLDAQTFPTAGAAGLAPAPGQPFAYMDCHAEKLVESGLSPLIQASGQAGSGDNVPYSFIMHIG